MRPRTNQKFDTTKKKPICILRLGVFGPTKKPLRSAPKRLQGMLLKAQKFDTTIVHKTGPQMHLADTLSRAYSYLPNNDNAQEEFETISAVTFLSISERREQSCNRQIRMKCYVQLLKGIVLKGWPNEKTGLPAVLAPYYSFRDELTVQDGLIFRGERLVIPKDVRSKMKKELHSSHICINGCLRRARECMFWPGMNAYKKEYIAQCETCKQYKPKQQKETLMSHEIAERPWERLEQIYTPFSERMI